MDNSGFQQDGAIELKRLGLGINDRGEIETALEPKENSRDRDVRGKNHHVGDISETKEAQEEDGSIVKDQTVKEKAKTSKERSGDIQCEDARKEVEGLLLKQPRPSLDNSIKEQTVSNLKDFDERFTLVDKPSKTVAQTLAGQLPRCSKKCLRKKVFSIFPFINILRNYKIRQDLTGDIVAGLTVGIMYIPQGMAYALLATLPPVYGLYTSFFPVLVYFFFGTSRHAALGPASVPCLMIGSTVSKGIDRLVANGLVLFPQESFVFDRNVTDNQSDITTTTKLISTDNMSPEEINLRLQFAMSVTLMVGIIQLLMSLFRLGFITDYMSDSLISGFTTGVACHVFTSQLQNIFSVRIPRYSGVFKLIYVYRDFFTRIDTVNYFTVVLAAVSSVILYCTQRFINLNPKLKPKMFMPVPIELIVVVLGTVFSFVFQFEETFDVAVVSDIPTGLPVPDTKGLTRLSWSIVQDAIPIVIVNFSISISIAKLMAKKNNYEVDANQELLAFGVSTVVCSFFSSLTPMAALSRAVVQERVGGKTQIAGLVSCSLLLVVLLAIGQYFKTTPKCVLAAVIIVSLRALLSQIFDLKKVYTMSKINFSVWIVAFLATLVLDVDLGLVLAVTFNLLVVIFRVQRPNACLLGRMALTTVYCDIEIYQEAKELPGIKIVRYEQSLFFLNKDHFRSVLSKKVVNPSTLAKQFSKKTTKDVTIEVVLLDSKENSKDIQVKKSTEFELDFQKSESDGHVHTIIIDCSPWNFIDTMGINCLKAIIEEYRNVGIQILLANCKDGIQEMFRRTNFYDNLDQSNVYFSLHDAVLSALETDGQTCSIKDKSIDKSQSTALENGKFPRLDVHFEDGISRDGEQRCSENIKL